MVPIGNWPGEGTDCERTVDALDDRILDRVLSIYQRLTRVIGLEGAS